MNPLGQSRPIRSSLSGGRRQLLWNITEPGDPYDIKRSMIAKMPGDKKPFMGEYIELVCLLQAAQIERQCEFLDYYKLKCQEIERTNLDRHSYEVQIKELTQKLNEEESYKLENSKLVDFVKRQTAQIQYLQRNNRDASVNQQKNYERSLEAVNQLTAENRQLKQRNQELRVQIMNFNARYQSLERAKNKEIEEIRMNYTMNSKESYEQSLATLRIQYDGEIKRYEMENKRLKENLETKNIQIIDLYKFKQEANFQLAQSKDIRALQSKIDQYQNRFMVVGQEVERLNITIRDYVKKLEDSQRKKKEMERIIEKYELEKKQYQIKIKNQFEENTFTAEKIRKYQIDLQRYHQNQYSNQYQQKISNLTKTIDSLNFELRSQRQTTKRFKDESDRLAFENSKIKILQRQYNDLKNSSTELQSYKIKIVQYEGKLAFLSQQVERLHSVNKNANESDQKYRKLYYEYEQFKTQMKDYDTTMKSRYEYDFNKIRAEYEQKIEYLSKTKGSQIQTRIQNYEQQFDKLQSQLKIKSEQSEKYRGRIYELQTMISRKQIQNKQVYQSYQDALAKLRRQNEEYFHKTKNYSYDVQKKVMEYQTKITSLQRQLERSVLTLRSKQEQSSLFKTKIRQYENITQKTQLDYSRKVTSYEQNMNIYKNQNQVLKRRINDITNQANKKNGELVQEMDRLGTILKRQSEEKNQKDQLIAKLRQELEVSRGNFNGKNNESEELRKRLSQLQARYNSLINESTSKLRITSEELENLKRQLNQNNNSYQSNEFEMKKVLSTYDVNFKSLKQENDHQKRVIQQYENKMAQIGQQFQRLTNITKSKTQQLNESEKRNKAQSQQLQRLIKQMKEYELSVNNTFENEVRKKYANYQQNIQVLTSQNAELKRKIFENDANFKNLLQDNQKMRSIINQLNIDIETSKKQLLAKDNNWNSFENEYKSRIASYETNLKSLSKANEEYQKKIPELDYFIKQKNEEAIKSENNVKQLSLQNENLRKKFKEYEYSLTQNYQIQMTKRINSYQDAIKKLNIQNEDLKKKFNQYNAEFNKRLAQNENKYNILGKQYEKQVYQFKSLSEENESLKKKLNNFENQVGSYSTEVQKRFQDYEQILESASKQNAQFKRKLGQSNEIIRKLSESQGKIPYLNKQLQKSVLKIRELQLENDSLRKKINVHQQNIQIIQRENEQLKKVLSEYQQRLSRLIPQSERLTSTIKVKSQQNSKLQSTVRTYANENELYKRKIMQIQNLITTKYQNEANRKISNLQQKVAAYSAQNEQLKRIINDKDKQLKYSYDQVQNMNNVIKNKHSENQALAKELQSWKKKYNDQEIKVKQTLQYDVAAKFKMYQQTISDYKRATTEYQNKVLIAMQEIQRLNNVLRLKAEEANQLSAKNKVLAQQAEQYRRKIQQLESLTSNNINSARRQNEELLRHYKELQYKYKALQQNHQNIMIQHENKFKVIAQEVQRLNQILKQKHDENQQIKKQFKEYFDSTNSQFESTTNKFKVQNEELKRKIVEYENKIVLLSQELERLNQSLRVKNEQAIKYQSNLKNVNRQLEDSRRRLHQFGDINRKVLEYEQRISLLTQQNERVANQLKLKIEQAKDYQQKLRQSRQQNQQNSYQYKLQIESHLKRRAQYDSKLNSLNQELQKNISLLRAKDEQYKRLLFQYQNLKKTVQQKVTHTQNQYNNLQNNYNALHKQYQNAKKHVLDYEQAIARLSAQFERLHGIINELKHEKQSLIEKNRILSEEIRRLTVQNKDFQDQTKDIRLRLTDETALQNRMNEHLSLMVLLFAQIQTLRNRIKDKEKEVVQVRKSSLAPHMI